MRTEQILSADLLDILFENRNKSYGAYHLRKFYQQRLVKAMALTFLSAGAIIFSFEYFKTEKAIKPFIPDILVGSVYLPKDLEKPEAPKPKITKPKPAIKAPSQLFVSNVVITKKESEATLLAKNLDSVSISNVTQVGSPHERPLVQGPQPGLVTTKAPISDVVDNITPMYTADIMPSYPGGMEALRKFLQQHLQNPEEMEIGKVISVKIKFVVEYDGKLKAFETMEDGGAVFNNEVIRVLRKMREWIPGKSNGQNVSVYYTIPVKFTAAE
jgi:protein TonB